MILKNQMVVVLPVVVGSPVVKDAKGAMQRHLLTKKITSLIEIDSKTQNNLLTNYQLLKKHKIKEVSK